MYGMPRCSLVRFWTACCASISCIRSSWARERIGIRHFDKRVSYYSTPMTSRPVLTLAVSFLVLGLVPALADTQIIPQVADGAGWSTTIVLANKTSTTQTVALSFNMDTANGATTPWTLQFLEGVSQSSISLAAGSTLFLHTPGTSTTLTEGWGQVDAAAGVTGYAIFTDRASGPAQDATAPAVSASNRILVPFDSSSGFISAIAVANPTNADETVQANIRTSDGTFSGTL